MEPDVDSLILLFHRSTYAQRTEAITRLNQYIEGGYVEKDRIIKESERRNSIKKMNVGPTSIATCVCCGR